MKQLKACRSINPINEHVALPAVSAFVGGVVQLEAENRGAVVLADD
jgi:hypothetical protein